MNTVRTAVRKGFTLVEILIVVVILGILAAIVIPQFSSASQAANASSLTTQLQSLRSQLELYQLQHNGVYPGVDEEGGFAGSDDFWNDLTGFTDIDGESVDVDEATGRPEVGELSFGPYLQKRINNPFTRNDVVVTGDATSANDAWLYNPLTGRITGGIPQAIQDEVQLDADALDGDVTPFE